MGTWEDTEWVDVYDFLGIYLVFPLSTVLVFLLLGKFLERFRKGESSPVLNSARYKARIIGVILGVFVGFAFVLGAMTESVPLLSGVYDLAFRFAGLGLVGLSAPFIFFMILGFLIGDTIEKRRLDLQILLRSLLLILVILLMGILFNALVRLMVPDYFHS